MLFLENSYLKEFESKIKNIDKNNIILEQTAFYAKSGGQPGDIGKININENEINIIDTFYDNQKNIVHVSENKEDFEVGLKIKGKILTKYLVNFPKKVSKGFSIKSLNV